MGKPNLSPLQRQGFGMPVEGAGHRSSVIRALSDRCGNALNTWKPAIPSPGPARRHWGRQDVQRDVRMCSQFSCTAGA
jgi:hypothetical protein